LFEQAIATIPIRDGTVKLLYLVVLLENVWRNFHYEYIGDALQRLALPLVVAV
jgi:hypothetical protein